MMHDLRQLKITNSPMGPNGPIALATHDGFSLRFEPLESLNKFEALAFAIHEAVPGHFFQFLYQQRLV